MKINIHSECRNAVIVDGFPLQNDVGFVAPRVLFNAGGPERPIDRTHFVAGLTVKDCSAKTAINSCLDTNYIQIRQHFNGIAEIGAASHDDLNERNGAACQAESDCQLFLEASFAVLAPSP